MSLQDALDNLPGQPGCYLMKDAEGTVLYVGKAANLRSRVRSYFQAGADHSPRIARMVRHVDDISLLVTGSEIEALVLEANLVKVHQPRYNVRLRDDKRFPFLKLTAEPFPQLVECREIEADGARYFGPFTDSGSMREAAKLIRELFGIRTCTFRLTGEAQMRPCLDYHIGLCQAPCAALQTADDYAANCALAAAFLRGDTGGVVDQLTADMHEAAEALEFERAARLRDRLADVRKVVERQRVVSQRRIDADVLAVAQHLDLSCVQLCYVRAGKVIGEHHAVFDSTTRETADVPLRAFLTAYYGQQVELPRQILLSTPIEDVEAFGRMLSLRVGYKVELLVPERGELRGLVALASDNATRNLQVWLADRDRQKQRSEEALLDLRERLGLPRTPFRLECYDIATLQGEENVGSMVVFENGRPQKNAYRKFKVRMSATAPDDYGMMREVLTRRLQRALAGDAKFLPLPDLLVVDGGKGQLGVAVEVTQQLGLHQLPLAALAKRHEEVFLPGRPEPVLIEERAASLRLLRALRDEAHRLANSYHQRLRRDTALRSILDDIPGVGAKRRTALLSHFRTTEAIREASLDELAAIPGMNRPAAEAVKAYLSGQVGDDDR